MLRRKTYGLLNVTLPVFNALSGQTENQIQAQVVESSLAGVDDGCFSIGNRVNPAQKL